MKNASINGMSTLFLQTVVVLVGIATLAFLLGEPHFEGRNVNATLFQIYFTDPFLAYAYIASIPFFVALFQAFAFLGYARTNDIFSQRSVQALRTIEYCAMAMVIFIIGGVAFLLLGESDDRPPVIVMGTIATLISVTIAAAADVIGRMVRSALERKSAD